MLGQLKKAMDAIAAIPGPDVAQVVGAIKDKVAGIRAQVVETLKLVSACTARNVWVKALDP